MATYNGNASFFTSCPVGHDCCDGAFDIAYGYVFTDQACGLLPQRACDINVIIQDNCKNTLTQLPISTQCSCAAELGSCSGQTRCNGNLEASSTPILDLTEDLFMFLHGSLTDGRVRFSVTT
jgi:hypothetical protein